MSESIVPSSHVAYAIEQAMECLEDDWKDENGEWECPWSAYEHYCLEVALRQFGQPCREAS